MKTFSTKRNEENTVFFAPQESSYPANKYHFLFTKCHAQEIQQQSYGFQAFCVENTIRDFF
jgi:hypothetical protein